MNNHIYTVVGILPEDVRLSILNIQKELGIYPSENLGFEENFLILKDTSHIAIKRTFSLNVGVDEKRITNLLSEIKIPPLALKTDNVGYWEKSNYGGVVYVKIVENLLFKKLHHDILNKLEGYITTKNPEHEGDGWIPHFTFSYNTNLDDSKKYTDFVYSKLLPLEFLLKKVLLLKDKDMSLDKREIIYQF